MRISSALFGVAAATLATPALAHPHVFIDNQVTLLVDRGVLTGFRTIWRFDEIFTADLLSQYDQDGDGQFSPAESKDVRDGTLPNLKGFHYFTYAYVGGGDLGVIDPADFSADIVDGVARFNLEFRLPTPVDAKQQKVGISVYDNEYYVEVLLAQADPVKLEGAGNEACKASVKDDQTHAYFGGFVVPQLIELSCQ